MHLSAEQKREWLHQHIPSRVFAALADVPLLRARHTQLPPENEREKFLHECWIQASWEGRHASIRWLIEFVGVVGLKDGRVIIARDDNRQKHDFNIGDLGGRFLDGNTGDAVALAKLRQDINKATGHPTHASAHDQITEPRLRGAAITIIKHLREQVYAPAGMAFFESL